MKDSKMAYRADKDIDEDIWSAEDRTVCLNCHNKAASCGISKEDGKYSNMSTIKIKETAILLAIPIYLIFDS